MFLSVSSLPFNLCHNW